MWTTAKSPEGALQFPTIRKTQVAGTGIVKGNHMISASHVKKKLMFGNSVERFPGQKDSLISNRQTRKHLAREGMSQDLP